MNAASLKQRLRTLISQPIPVPGSGQTAQRHRRLIEVGIEDLSLARLAEAHWDAVAILAEGGHQPDSQAVYGVWASEIPSKLLTVEAHGTQALVTGSKLFCSGAGIVDRALITVGLPEHRLIDLDLHRNAERVAYDLSPWKASAFAATNTGTVTFTAAEVSPDEFLGKTNWYLDRPGFWHGACGPAACWAGGALGLLAYAMASSRHDPHTIAHLAAMHADGWALRAYLDTAGNDIDLECKQGEPTQHEPTHPEPRDTNTALIRALTLRHLVEQSCTDILRRFARAYGPAPLAMDSEVSRRYQELDLYLRQSHAERDLEALGHSLLAATRPAV